MKAVIMAGGIGTPLTAHPANLPLPTPTHRRHRAAAPAMRARAGTSRARDKRGDGITARREETA